MVSIGSPSALPVVGVLADGRTYRHLLYLLLAIPLGFAYSALFSFGLVFGIVLSVVLVGVVLLLATLIGARIGSVTVDTGPRERNNRSVDGTRTYSPVRNDRSSAGAE